MFCNDPVHEVHPQSRYARAPAGRARAGFPAGGFARTLSHTLYTQCVHAHTHRMHEVTRLCTRYLVHLVQISSPTSTEGSMHAVGDPERRC